MTPRFSILIPSIPSRIAMMDALTEKLDAQIGSLPVEYCVFIDNKQRSIGAKRQALLDMSRGQYVAFIDDDDDISSDYVAEIMTAIDQHDGVDVIVFDQLCSFNDAEPVRILFGMEYKADTQVNVNANPAAYRRPWHVMAWRRALAIMGRFTDSMYGEDAAWVDQVAPLAKTQARIEKALLHYRYNDKITEAVQDE